VNEYGMLAWAAIIISVVALLVATGVI